jgi:lipopolysaccharide export system protein LptA
MKAILRLLACLAVLWAGSWAARAQEGQAAAKPDEAAKADEAAQPDEAAASNDAFGPVFGSDFFEKIKAEKISYDTSGALHLLGRVVFKGSNLTLDCDEMRADPEKKVMVATGTPVKIKQGDMQAECRRYHYDIEKRTSRLEGRPVIYQRQAGKMTKIEGDIITIVQDENGKSSVNITMLKDSNRVPTVEVIKDESSAPPLPKNKSNSPRKVNDKDKKGLEMIKLPEPSF